MKQCRGERTSSSSGRDSETHPECHFVSAALESASRGAVTAEFWQTLTSSSMIEADADAEEAEDDDESVTCPGDSSLIFFGTTTAFSDTL
jgi:hypothetical protein